jgi:hypothetical protein
MTSTKTKTHYMRPGASWSPCRRPAHRCVYTAAWPDVTCGNCLRSAAHKEALALTPQPADIQRYAASVQSMIMEDMTAGVIPDTARSFSELHDHVDANEYVIMALDGYQPRGDEGSEVITSDAETAMANAVMDAVDTWLRTRDAWRAERDAHTTKSQLRDFDNVTRERLASLPKLAG